MSYSLVTPCGACKKQIGCVDGYALVQAINTIHSMPQPISSPDGVRYGHLGSGSIHLKCNNFESRVPPNADAPAEGEYRGA